MTRITQLQFRDAFEYGYMIPIIHTQIYEAHQILEDYMRGLIFQIYHAGEKHTAWLHCIHLKSWTFGLCIRLTDATGQIASTREITARQSFPYDMAGLQLQRTCFYYIRNGGTDALHPESTQCLHNLCRLESQWPSGCILAPYVSAWSQYGKTSRS